jgi:hypothetical protein
MKTTVKNLMMMKMMMMMMTKRKRKRKMTPMSSWKRKAKTNLESLR